jgi:hypothetical protein
MVRRFLIIEETTEDGRTVNAELLRWYPSSGYAITGRRVWVQTLDSEGSEDSGDLVVGSKVWAIWMADSQAWEVVGPPEADLKKRLVRFTLNEALTTSDQFKAATITHQYGPGIDHTETTITVFNMLTHSPGTYLFEGDSGDAGLAMWDSDSNFIIIQMECP